MRKIAIAVIAVAGITNAASAQNCNNSLAFNARCSAAKPTNQNMAPVKVNRAALPGSPRIGQVVQFNGKLYKIISQDGGSFTLVAQGAGN